jgi:hypothetical protein
VNAGRQQHPERVVSAAVRQERLDPQPTGLRVVTPSRDEDDDENPVAAIANATTRWTAPARAYGTMSETVDKSGEL